MQITALDFINELLASFMNLVNTLFRLYFVPGVSIGGFLVALAVFGLFVRIFIVRLKNG